VIPDESLRAQQWHGYCLSLQTRADAIAFGVIPMFKRLFSNNKQPADYRIMIVDDDEAIRETVHAILADEGYQVFMAYNGDEAIKLLDELNPAPDALIVDLLMPGMNGKEFIERARVRFGRVALPPVLLLTGAKQGEAEANGLEIDDYLPKPFEHDILLQHVYTLIERGKFVKAS
jgi:DNA-binding response OmpR family regulator